MSHLTSNDLIFHKVNNKIISAGFGINSILMNKGMAPILSFTNDYNGDTSDTDSNSSSSSDSESDNENNKDNKNRQSKPKKQVFRSFKNLAIPINLFSMQDNSKTNVKEDEYMNDYGYLPDNIYDELFKLVEFDNKQKRQSKKNIKKNKSKHLKTYKTHK